MSETKLNLGDSEKFNVEKMINETEIIEKKPSEYENMMSNNIDPDLIVGYDIVKLPSGGKYYKNGLSEVEVEYLTSKDEDILSTPALIENGNAMDIILKRKIKTPNVNVDELLNGDKNAIILFLRTSSYGHEYNVDVTDPRTGDIFPCVVDLRKLNYKEINETPDIENLYNVFIPMRKKNIKFKLLTSIEEKRVFENSEAFKEAYGNEFSEYNTLKLKHQIIDIEGKRDKTYIHRFVDAMPALDSLTIRRKILDVTPDVDLKYEFKAKDGFKFSARLTLGIDFFFPNI